MDSDEAWKRCVCLSHGKLCIGLQEVLQLSPVLSPVPIVLRIGPDARHPQHLRMLRRPSRWIRQSWKAQRAVSSSPTFGALPNPPSILIPLSNCSSRNSWWISSCSTSSTTWDRMVQILTIEMATAYPLCTFQVVYSFHLWTKWKFRLKGCVCQSVWFCLE